MGSVPRKFYDDAIAQDKMIHYIRTSDLLPKKAKMMAAKARLSKVSAELTQAARDVSSAYKEIAAGEVRIAERKALVRIKVFDSLFHRWTMDSKARAHHQAFKDWCIVQFNERVFNEPGEGQDERNLPSGDQDPVRSETDNDKADVA